MINFVDDFYLSRANDNDGNKIWRVERTGRIRDNGLFLLSSRQWIARRIYSSPTYCCSTDYWTG